MCLTHFKAFLSCSWLPLPGREELRWEVQDVSGNGTDACVRCVYVTRLPWPLPKAGAELSLPSTSCWEKPGTVWPG